jgi:hypothetical protein
MIGGTQWPSWLRHCATSQKVVDSIPNVVTGIFHLHNPSAALWPPTEMSTRNNSHQTYSQMFDQEALWEIAI